MKSWCKHYSLDVLLGDKTRVCDAGINVRDLVGGKDFGWARRIPCNQKNESSVVCEKILLPTPEEQAKDEAEWKETFANIAKAMPFMLDMKAKHPDGGIGVAKCPICEGQLHWAIAGCNNHMRGKCETEGCLSWME